MAAIVYNLVLEQGTTFERTFDFVWTVDIQCTAKGTTTTPVTLLHLIPLPVAIPAGFLLKFSCDKILTVATAYVPTSNTIAVDPFVGTISAGSQCDGPSVDLSARTYECTIRSDYENEVLATPTVTPGVGKITISLPYTAVETLPAQLRREDLPAGDPEQLMQNSKIVAPFYKKGYPYQVEESYGGRKTRTLEGKAFVLREVVRIQ